mgnify:CR=1 FL=1
MLSSRKIVSMKLKRKNGVFVNTKGFQKPVTCSKLPKLYIVKHQAKIAYVGVTSQSITNRIRYGLIAKGKHGYHGYLWKDLKEELTILIWCFPGELPKSKLVESVEAEVVFTIRNHTGQWPNFQTEIHFHNTIEEEKKMAQLIYDQAKNI